MGRPLEDQEIKDMISFVECSKLGIVIRSNTVAMLKELLMLRAYIRVTSKLRGDLPKLGESS